MLCVNMCIIYCHNVYFQTDVVAMQQRMMDLEQQHGELEKENAGLHRNLKDCHILLVAAKVDPGECLRMSTSIPKRAAE